MNHIISGSLPSVPRVGNLSFCHGGRLRTKYTCRGNNRMAVHCEIPFANVTLVPALPPACGGASMWPHAINIAPENAAVVLLILHCVIGSVTNGIAS